MARLGHRLKTRKELSCRAPGTIAVAVVERNDVYGLTRAVMDRRSPGQRLLCILNIYNKCDGKRSGRPDLSMLEARISSFAIPYVPHFTIKKSIHFNQYVHTSKRDDDVGSWRICLSAPRSANRVVSNETGVEHIVST